jgi:hypothetical protein
VWGHRVSNDETSEQYSLEEGARRVNSNLQLLIEAIGGVLTASGDLLTRVQAILGTVQPTAGDTNGGHESGMESPADRSEE